MPNLGDLKIALIHDELIRRGGAEVVFEEMIRLFPQADIYSLYAGRPQITVDEQTHFIHTSFLQTWPRWWREHPSRILPFLPHAAEQMDFSQYDIVLSSSSAFAKGIVTRSHIPHICYCHTPTRYLWDSTHQLLDRLSFMTRWPTRLLLHYLRLVDFAAAQRVDAFLANSLYTQQRISAYYRRTSIVIYPPINTDFYTPGILSNRPEPTKRHFIIVGRLSPNKHIEQAIAVCEKLQLPLIIIGTGPERYRLAKLAGKYTSFTGKVSAEELRTHYRNARALIQISREDFGLATGEALACGLPVIAFGEGGVKEIVSHQVHGILYPEQRGEALAEGIRQFLLRERTFAPLELQRQAGRFTTNRFREALQKHVRHTLQTWQLQARLSNSLPPPMIETTIRN